MTERGHDYLFGRVLSALFILGGLWHAISPWVYGYADLRAAVVGNVVSGLVLALFGLIRAFGVRGWPTLACAIVGVWILIAPHAMGFGARGFAANEALWGGLMTIVVAGITALADRYDRPQAWTAHGSA
jgi:hypothetical protein